jgi:hypothetical protein
MKKYILLAAISIFSTGSILANDPMKPKPAITKPKKLTKKQLQAMQYAQEAQRQQDMAPFIAAEQERYEKELQATLSEIARSEHERQERIAQLAQEQESRLATQKDGIIAQREQETQQRANDFLYERRQRKQQKLLREAARNSGTTTPK